MTNPVIERDGLIRSSADYTVADQLRMGSAVNYFDWQCRLAEFQLGRRVLEVGCGVGNFTSRLLDREMVVAIDVEAQCVDRLRRRYPDQANLHAEVCDVNSSGFSLLRRFELDSCVCLNVLEHIENDGAALVAMRDVISPQGAIVLIVPAFPALYGPIDRYLGHYRRYTRSSITRLAQSVGMRIRHFSFLNSVGFFGWWLNARILRLPAQSETQIRAFDRYVVPALSLLEEVIPPPFGQSMLVVLERS